MENQEGCTFDYFSRASLAMGEYLQFTAESAAQAAIGGSFSICLKWSFAIETARPNVADFSGHYPISIP